MPLDGTTSSISCGILRLGEGEGAMMIGTGTGAGTGSDTSSGFSGSAFLDSNAVAAANADAVPSVKLRGRLRRLLDSFSTCAAGLS